MSTLDYDEAKKKRPRKKKMIRISLAVGILGIVVGAIYFGFTTYQYNYGSFKGYTVKESVEKGDDNSTQFTSYKNNLLKVSRDGVMALDTEGEYIWNGSYEMLDPVFDLCGDYVAIAERNGTQISIFGEKGLVNSITVEHPVLSVQIANQGVVAVMMEESNSVYISIYASNGSEKWAYKKELSSTGFPLSMTLSNDGKKLVLSYLETVSGTLTTNIACYNMDETGRNENQNFVGGSIYEGEVVPKVDFLANNVVCFYKDTGFVLYKMNRKLGKEPIKEVTFETPIRSVFSSSSYVGVITESGDDKEKYIVTVYDLAGKKVLEKGINYDYISVSMKDTEILFYDYSGCMILNTKGKVRFQTDFNENIVAMCGATKNKYYVVYGDRIDLIQLRGGK